MASSSTLPPDLFDTTTLVSLAATVAILGAAYGISQRVLAPGTPVSLRTLFIWHAFDALIHFCLEGGFLYHCLFSWRLVSDFEATGTPFYPDPHNYMGHTDRAYGSQSAGNNPLAQLWMVYARADRRWGGIDLGVVALEILTVCVVGPLAVLVCYDIAKKNPRANITMIVIATAELYGGFMTFCPEWLVGNENLDGSNFMYLWLYLVFFNVLWVFFPVYAVYVSSSDIFNAFSVRNKVLKAKKAT